MAFLRLLRVEWIKLARMRSTYIAFAAAGILIVTVQFGMYFAVDKSHFYRFFKLNGFDTRLLVNAYTATRIALEAGFMLLIGPMIIMIFARQIAGEDLRGTLRMMLTRPIGRPGLIHAKFIVCTGYCMALMGFFLLLSYGMGTVLFGSHRSITVGRIFEETDPGPAAPAPGERSSAGAKEGKEKAESAPPSRRERRRQRRETRFFTMARSVISPGQCLIRMALALALATWALVTLGSIAFFFSTFNRYPIAAMALTVGSYFLVIIVQGLASSDNMIPLFQSIRPYLFTTAMDIWRGSFSYEIDWERIGREASLLGAYTAVLYLAALAIFWRKDITS